MTILTRGNVHEGNDGTTGDILRGAHVDVSILTRSSGLDGIDDIAGSSSGGANGHVTILTRVSETMLTQFHRIILTQALDEASIVQIRVVEA